MNEHGQDLLRRISTATNWKVDDKVRDKYGRAGTVKHIFPVLEPKRDGMQMIGVDMGDEMLLGFGGEFESVEETS